MTYLRTAVCVWFSCLAIHASATDVIRITPVEFNARDTATVYIELENETEINGYNFILNYDATILFPVTIEPVDRSFTFSDTEGYQFADGQISFVGFDRQAVNLLAATGGYLFKIQFVSVDPNAFREPIDTELSIDQFSFANSDLELIALESISSTISILPTSNEYEEDLATPIKFKLHSNYPNPFNPSTTIRFDLPSASEVSLVVYDILGRVIKRIYREETMSFGNHSVVFDAESFASGMYLYKIIAKPVAGGGTTHTDTGKMMLIK